MLFTFRHTTYLSRHKIEKNGFRHLCKIFHPYCGYFFVIRKWSRMWRNVRWLAASGRESRASGAGAESTGGSRGSRGSHAATADDSDYFTPEDTHTTILTVPKVNGAVSATRGRLCHSFQLYSYNLSIAFANTNQNLKTCSRSVLSNWQTDRLVQRNSHATQKLWTDIPVLSRFVYNL